MLVQGRPGRSKDLLRWAKQSPPPVVTRPDHGDSPHPAPPVPPQQPTEIVDTTPKVVSTVSIPVLTSEAPWALLNLWLKNGEAPLPALPCSAGHLIGRRWQSVRRRPRPARRPVRPPPVRP